MSLLSGAILFRVPSNFSACLFSPFLIVYKKLTKVPRHNTVDFSIIQAFQHSRQVSWLWILAVCSLPGHLPVGQLKAKSLQLLVAGPLGILTHSLFFLKGTFYVIILAYLLIVRQEFYLHNSLIRAIPLALSSLSLGVSRISVSFRKSGSQTKPLIIFKPRVPSSQLGMAVPPRTNGVHAVIYMQYFNTLEIKLSLMFFFNPEISAKS